MTSNKIFISGYAKLPKGITASELYSVIAIGLLVNRQTGEILDAEGTLVTEIARNFLRDNLIGENINNIEHIEKNFNDNYFGSARKAVLSALRTCHERYRQVVAGVHDEDME